AAVTSSSTQTRMYMVIGTAPRARPARAAPASMADRLTAIRSGVAQLSSAPSAASPASRSLWGPSAARYTGAAGQPSTPGEAGCGHPGLPAPALVVAGLAVTC